VLLRGVTLLVRCGNKPDAPPAARALLAPTRWRHGDTGLMCLCTAQARPAGMPDTCTGPLKHHHLLASV